MAVDTLISPSTLLAEQEAKLEYAERMRQRLVDMKPFFLGADFVETLSAEGLKKHGLVFPADAKLTCLQYGFVCSAYLKAFFTLLFHYNTNLKLKGDRHFFELINSFCKLSADGQLTPAESAQELLDHDEFLIFVTVPTTKEDAEYARDPVNKQLLREETLILEKLVKAL